MQGRAERGHVPSRTPRRPGSNARCAFLFGPPHFTKRNGFKSHQDRTTRPGGPGLLGTAPGEGSGVSPRAPVCRPRRGPGRSRPRAAGSGAATTAGGDTGCYAGAWSWRGGQWHAPRTDSVPLPDGPLKAAQAATFTRISHMKKKLLEISKEKNHDPWVEQMFTEDASSGTWPHGRVGVASPKQDQGWRRPLQESVCTPDTTCPAVTETAEPRRPEPATRSIEPGPAVRSAASKELDAGSPRAQTSCRFALAGLTTTAQPPLKRCSFFTEGRGHGGRSLQGIFRRGQGQRPMPGRPHTLQTSEAAPGHTRPRGPEAHSKEPT